MDISYNGNMATTKDAEKSECSTAIYKYQWCMEYNLNM